MDDGMDEGMDEMYPYDDKSTRQTTPGDLSQHLGVIITSVYGEYTQACKLHNAIVYTKHPKVTAQWRIKEHPACKGLQVSPSDYMLMLDYLNGMCGCNNATREHIDTYIKSEIDALSPRFELELSQHLTVKVIGKDNTFDCRFVRVEAVNGNQHWHMREPIWSEWMQTDQGTFLDIMNYLVREHWCEVEPAIINDYIKRTIGRV